MQLTSGEGKNIQDSIQGLEANVITLNDSDPQTQSHVQEDVSPASSLIPIEPHTQFRRLELLKTSSALAATVFVIEVLILQADF